MSKLSPYLKSLLRDKNKRQTETNADPEKDQQSVIAPRSAGQQETQPEKLRVMIHFNGNVAELQAVGFEVFTIAGPIITGQIPVNRIEELAALDSVVKIEGDRPVRPRIDRSRTETHTINVHTAAQPIRGTGVIVGIIDTGIDFHHSALRKGDGSTRLIRLWDQTLTPEGAEVTPNGSTGSPLYGVEYGQQMITDTLTLENPPLRVRAKDHDDEHGHGTHVAGIAAGDGSVSGNCRPTFTFVGMAPDADIIGVAMGKTGSTNKISDGVWYILNEASLRGKRAVVNISFGHDLGPHDSSDSLDLAVDQHLVTFPNGIVVVAAGNAANDGVHAKGTVTAGATVNVNFFVRSGATDDISLDIWYPGSDSFAFTITPPGGSASTSVSPGNSPTLTLSNTNQAEVISEQNDPTNGDKNIFVTLMKNSRSDIQSGVWTFSLTGTTVTNGAFHAWIDTDKATFSLPNNTTNPFLDNNFSMGSPATALNVIAVASYITNGSPEGDISDFSGRGPTRPSTSGPAPASRDRIDIAAPGEMIMSAFSSWIEGVSFCCRDQYHALQGTSMAAPHVTGVIALMLQKNRGLTRAQVVQFLKDHARKDSHTGPTPDGKIWGAGKLETLAAINAITADSSFAASPAQPTSGSAENTLVPVMFAPTIPSHVLRRVREDILTTHQGKIYAAVFARNLVEVQTLINSNKRVATVWHRNNGPILLRHLIKAVEKPDVNMPMTIDEKPVATCIEKFLAILQRYGSETLKQDIQNYADDVFGWLGLSYNQLLMRLQAMHETERLIITAAD